LDDTISPIEEKNTLQAPCKEPQISLHDLSSFLAPQTLKLIAYIKYHKVIVLINSNTTHNFNHRRMVEETYCYVCAIPDFQIMISSGGIMKCGG
jgi:hypothetical protein